MIYNLSESNSLANNFLAEIRDVNIQKDRLRFRKNMERLGEIFAYEISKELSWVEKSVTTPLGVAKCKILAEQPVIAGIMRAGLVLHQGLLNFFDKADNAFIGAYRKHDKTGAFKIRLEYYTSPPLNDRVLILADPMLATGASVVDAIKELQKEGAPAQIHVVTCIASIAGVEYLKRQIPNVKLWTAAIDQELTAKSFIVPGLGDAGDLLFGAKTQE